MNEAIMGAVARGWCAPENATKVMDSDLAVAIAREIELLYPEPQSKPFDLAARQRLRKVSA